MLIVIQVGHDEASERYVRNKKKAIEAAGMCVTHVVLPESASEETILQEIRLASWNSACSAIMVQLPLPPGINKDRILRAIPPEMDIDGLNPDSPYKPLTPCAIMRWLKKEGVELEGKHVAILGKSDLVGKPLSQMMMDAGATVTVMGSKTPTNVRHWVLAVCDILVSAVGQPDVVTVSPFRVFSTPRLMIDVGINRDENGRLCGDISRHVRNMAAENGSVCTPVPGGVGKWTVEELVLRLKEMEDSRKNADES